MLFFPHRAELLRCSPTADSLAVAPLSEAAALLQDPQINAVIAKRPPAEIAAGQRLLAFLGVNRMDTRCGGFDAASLEADIGRVLDRFLPAEAAQLPIFAAGRAALLADMAGIARQVMAATGRDAGAVILWAQPAAPVAPEWHQDDAQLVGVVSYMGAGTQVAPNLAVQWGGGSPTHPNFAPGSVLPSMAQTADTGDAVLMKGRLHADCAVPPRSRQVPTAAVHRSNPGHGRIVAVLSVG